MFVNCVIFFYESNKSGDSYAAKKRSRVEITNAEVLESIGKYRYLSYFTLLYRKLNSLAETRYTYLYLSLLFLLIRNYLGVNVNHNDLTRRHPRFSISSQFDYANIQDNHRTVTLLRRSNFSALTPRAAPGSVKMWM